MNTTETEPAAPGTPVFFDLETKPDQERTRSWTPEYPPFEQPPPFDPDALLDRYDWPGAKSDAAPAKLPSEMAKELGVKIGNLKDEDKIWAKLQGVVEADIKTQTGALAQWEDGLANHEAKFFGKAALSPRTASIFMLQYARGDDEITILEGAEDDILRDFFGLLDNSSNQFFVNWTGSSNKANFDLNMLFRRGIDLDLWLPDDIRPTSWGGSTTRFMDLTPRLLGHADWNSYCSLEDAAKELHIPVTPSVVTGEHCWRYYDGIADAEHGCLELSAERQRELSLEYGRQDVHLLRRIYQRLCEV